MRALGPDPDVGGADPAPLDPGHLQLERVDRQPLQPGPQRLGRPARVQQRPEDHVPGHAGEAVEVGEGHGGTRSSGGPGLRPPDPRGPEDPGRQGAGPEAVVDVDHAHPDRARVQHGEQGGQPVEGGPVADAGRHRHHRHGHHPGDQRRQGALHPGHHHQHAGRLEPRGLGEQPVGPGDAHVDQGVDPAAERLGRDLGLLGHGQVAGPGADHPDQAGRRPVPVQGPADQHAGAGMPAGVGGDLPDRLGVPGRRPGHQHRRGVLGEQGGHDRRRLGRRLAGAVDDLGPAAQGAVVVDAREAEVLERQGRQAGHGVLGGQLAPGHGAEKLSKPTFIQSLRIVQSPPLPSPLASQEVTPRVPAAG